MQRFVAIRGRDDRAARAQRVHEGCGTDGDGHRAETRKGGRNQTWERNEERNEETNQDQSKRSLRHCWERRCR